MIHYKYTVKKTTDVSFRIIWSLLQKQYLEISTACKEDSDLFHPYSECNEYISSKTMPHKCSNQGEFKKKDFPNGNHIFHWFPFGGATLSLMVSCLLENGTDSFPKEKGYHGKLPSWKKIMTCEHTMTWNPGGNDLLNLTYPYSKWQW